VVTPDGRWVYVSEATGVAAIRTSTRAVTRIKAGPASITPPYDGASINQPCRRTARPCTP
jgi:hypothetical protein